MKQVALLTEQQKDTLERINVSPHWYFNPIQDINNNWIISTEEVEATNIGWVKNLPLIDFKPIPEEPPS